MFIKTALFAALALGVATMGQHLIAATWQFITGEQALAHIDPYASAPVQDAQIAGAMAQISQARTGAQAPQP